jgi:hypothetical protein
MKLQTLFEDHGLPSSFLIDRTIEYRKLAKEYELVLKSGKGIPDFTQKGAWIGFGIAPLGGSNAEQKSAEDRMPFDIRVKGFLLKLAKLLEKDLADGYKIELTVGGDKKNKKPLEPGSVKDALQKNFIYGPVPGGAYSKFAGKEEGISGAWFISKS